MPTLLYPLDPQKVKDRRAELGVIQDDLKRAGLSSRTIWMVEGGAFDQGVTRKTADTIASVLQCDVESLLSGPPVAQRYRKWSA